MPLSLLNPWVILAFLAALAGAFGYGHHQAAIEQAAEVARLNEVARATEQRMQADANANANKLRKANQDAQAQIDSLKRDVSTGAVRLSIATRSVPACPDAGATPGGGGQARAELDPTAAQDLIAIAADGDDAIRQLNACIDLYNQIRSTTP